MLQEAKEPDEDTFAPGVDLNDELSRGDTEYIELKMASQWGLKHEILHPCSRIECEWTEYIAAKIYLSSCGFLESTKET